MAFSKYGFASGLFQCRLSFAVGMRLGYLVVPQDLIEPACTVKALMDNGHAWLDQATLADFIASGSFMRHLRTIRHTYLQRRNCLVEELHRYFGDVQLTGLDGGMHLIWHLPSYFSPAVEVQRIAEDVGVGVYCLESGAAYCSNNTPHNLNVLMLGYSSVSRQMIKTGIERLSKSLMPMWNMK